MDLHKGMFLSDHCCNPAAIRPQLHETLPLSHGPGLPAAPADSLHPPLLRRPQAYSQGVGQGRDRVRRLQSGALEVVEAAGPHCMGG